ncbi:hypothetical protein [Treponema endosymbiont of Eucomonympha sp.]|uniref:hypothetical protein n=1 Tax=Treponema endosymbiont of Eucomonympha sp. TaxID=1580831 RepID=UPI000750F64B|nr:hypothetical protein [Treponema endosymbiont of Eucomonympha sp.]
MPKVSGKDGKLYMKHYGTPINGPTAQPIAAGVFYKIVTLGSPTGWPPAAAGMKSVDAGGTFFVKAGFSLKAGDSVLPVTLTPLGFVKDTPKSQQGASFDISTQEDLERGVRSFASSPFTDSSGSISGILDSDSEDQRKFLNMFTEISYTEAATISRSPAKQVLMELMLSRRETSTPGETAMWENFPLTADSLTTDKPFEEGQPFTFNYKLNGAEHPSVIFYTVPAASELEKWRGGPTAKRTSWLEENEFAANEGGTL